MSIRQPGDSARKTSRRRRTAALTGAILLHLLLIVSLVASASGVVSRGAEDDSETGDAIEVSLSGWEGARSAGSGSGRQIAEQDSLALMMRRLQSQDSDLYVDNRPNERPRGDLSQLFQALGQVAGTGRQGQGRDQAGTAADGGQKARTATASVRGELSDDISAGDLFGQVEPCWRRLPQRSAVAVSLEVVLNDQGRLALPPRIIRAASAAPDETRLVAEARALSAIAACLPYKAVTLPGSKRTYRLDFKPSS